MHGARFTILYDPAGLAWREASAVAMLLSCSL